MGGLPQILPKTLRKVLLAHGFTERPGKGSHRVFVHADGRRTILAIHNKPITKGTLAAILKQAALTIKDLN